MRKETSVSIRTLCLLCVIIMVIPGLFSGCKSTNIGASVGLTNMRFTEKFPDSGDPNIPKAKLVAVKNNDESYPYFDEPTTVKLNSWDLYGAISTRVTYIDVGLSVEIPRTEAKRLNLINNDGYLVYERVLESEELTEKYFTVYFLRAEE